MRTLFRNARFACCQPQLCPFALVVRGLPLAAVHRGGTFIRPEAIAREREHGHELAQCGNITHRPGVRELSDAGAPVSDRIHEPLEANHIGGVLPVLQAFLEGELWRREVSDLETSSARQLLPP